MHTRIYTSRARGRVTAFLEIDGDAIGMDLAPGKIVLQIMNMNEFAFIMRDFYTKMTL